MRSIRGDGPLFSAGWYLDDSQAGHRWVCEKNLGRPRCSVGILFRRRSTPFLKAYENAARIK